MGGSALPHGTIELIVLALLKQSDMYGGQFAKEILDRSGETISIQPTSIYPVLYRLHENKYISDYEVPFGKRKVKVYYHLEPAGEERLNKLYTHYKSFTAALENVLAVCN